MRLSRRFGLFCLLLATGTVAGCSVFSSANRVETITPDSGAVQRADDGRFQNLYPGKKSYPVTCEEDCYPASDTLSCEDDTGVCSYRGVNQIPELDSGFAVTWLGHASFAITLPDGGRVLFDPVSEQFDWPIDWLNALSGGITRKRPAWPVGVVQDVDAVMYSHLHYDHFNKSDIAKLGNTPRYFVHQGTADYLPDNNLDVKEMSWFAEYSQGEVKVHAVPAHHFNSRYWVPFIYDDSEQALWGGWVLEHDGHTLFFAGDTGYSAHFKDIGDHFGHIDICLLPIASYYHPEHGRWYRYVHTTPEDAITAAEDMGCRVMIPWGYGNASWQMGDHSSHSALKRLLKMYDTLKPSVPLVILNEGESVSL